MTPGYFLFMKELNKMVNRLEMANVKTIQVLHKQGWSRRRIAREPGLDRQTVRHYLRTGGAEE